MTLQLLGKIQKKSNFIFIFGQIIEDQVLFHLPKFGGNIFSLRNFPDPLKGHDEAVPQRAGFGSLKSVSTHRYKTKISDEFYWATRPERTSNIPCIQF